MFLVRLASRSVAHAQQPPDPEHRLPLLSHVNQSFFVSHLIEIFHLGVTPPPPLEKIAVEWGGGSQRGKENAWNRNKKQKKKPIQNKSPVVN